MYNLLITNRKTGEITILETDLTERQAERECEQWGWMYDDGYQSYYMSYEEKTR